MPIIDKSTGKRNRWDLRLELQPVLPYWAIYRRLGYIWESFAKKNCLRYFLYLLYFGLHFKVEKIAFWKQILILFEQKNDIFEKILVTSWDFRKSEEKFHNKFWLPPTLPPLWKFSLALTYPLYFWSSLYLIMLAHLNIDWNAVICMSGFAEDSSNLTLTYPWSIHPLP